MPPGHQDAKHAKDFLYSDFQARAVKVSWESIEDRGHGQVEMMKKDNSPIISSIVAALRARGGRAGSTDGPPKAANDTSRRANPTSFS